MECPECHLDVPDDFNFCNRCGFNLTRPSESTPKELSFDEKIKKIQKYLPEGLTEKVYSREIESKANVSSLRSCSLIWRALHLWLIGIELLGELSGHRSIGNYREMGFYIMTF